MIEFLIAVIGVQLIAIVVLVKSLRYANASADAAWASAGYWWKRWRNLSKSGLR